MYVLEKQLIGKTIKEFTALDASDSPFKQIFQIIFRNQSQNISFIKGVVREIVALVYKHHKEEEAVLNVVKAAIQKISADF